MKDLRVMLKAFVVMSALAVFFVCCIYTSSIYAADGSVRMWRDSEDNNFVHQSIALGNKYDTLSLKIKNIDVDKISWTVDNSDILRIEGASGKKPVLHGLKEGTTTLRVTVTDKDKSVYKDSAFISVYTPFTRVSGHTNKAETVYLTANDKEDKRGNVGKQQKLTVSGSCGAFYRVTLPDGFKFDDEFTHTNGFIKKSAITIPVTSLSVKDNSISLEPGQKKSISVTVLPAQATDKSLKFSSKSKKTAAVDGNGTIAAKKAGKTSITVASSDNTCIATVKVNVTPKASHESVTNFQSTRAWISKTTTTSVTIKWRKVPKASKYIIYKKTLKNGKFTKKKIATIDKKKTSYTVKKLKPGKTYYFSINPSKSGSYSYVIEDLMAVTKSKITKKNKKAAGKVFAKKHNYITIANNNNCANGVFVQKDNKKYYPYVQYTYNKKDNILNAHIFVKFAGKSVNSKVSGGMTYKKAILDGIKRAYTVDVVGSKYNFGANVKFKFRPVIHDLTNKKTTSRDFITIQVGEYNNGDSCASWTAGNKWFHAHATDLMYDYNGKKFYSIWILLRNHKKTICMPSREMTKNNEKSGYKVDYYAEEYGATAAHELGHMLGLDDGYDTKNRRGVAVRRLKGNSEKAVKINDPSTKKFRWSNLMTHSHETPIILSNDVEMMLTAYKRAITNGNNGMAEKGNRTWQSYTEYELDDKIYNKSSAIKM